MMQTSAPPSSSHPRVTFAHQVRDQRWLRRFFVAVLVIAAIVVAVRVLLDPLAAHFTRKALHEANGIDGRLANVHVGIFPPSYTIRDLKIIEAPGGDWDHALFNAYDVRLDLNWRRLLHAVISAQMRIDAPKIHYTNRKQAKAGPSQTKPELPNPRAALSQLIPARVDRIEVRNGEFLFRDATLPGKPAIGLHRIEVAAENLATRRRLSNGEPATLSLSAELGQSGAVRAFVSSDLFATSLTAAGNAELRGWHVAELYAFEEPTTKLETTHGTIDLFAEFKIEKSTISGGVKPVLKNVEVRAAQTDLGTKLKAWLADAALDLFSDRVPNRNAVATVIPIEGRLDNPDVQLWPTVLGILRNAFVEGISSGFAHLPPPVASEKQNPVEQAADALSKQGNLPKAQPDKAQQKRDPK